MKPTNISINSETGEIHRTYMNGKVLKVKGRDNGLGYLQLGIGGRTKYFHRVVWEHANGPIPAGFQIDHINGDKSDNRITNLRIVTKHQNMQNQHRAHTRSKTGVKGVHWCNKRQKYGASIAAFNKSQRLGWFDSIQEAADAYAVAADLLHTHNPTTKKKTPTL